MAMAENSLFVKVCGCGGGGGRASDLMLVGYGFVLNCVLGCGGCSGCVVVVVGCVVVVTMIFLDCVWLVVNIILMYCIYYFNV